MRSTAQLEEQSSTAADLLSAGVHQSARKMRQLTTEATGLLREPVGHQQRGSLPTKAETLAVETLAVTLELSRSLVTGVVNREEAERQLHSRVMMQAGVDESSHCVPIRPMDMSRICRWRCRKQWQRPLRSASRVAALHQHSDDWLRSC